MTAKKDDFSCQNIGKKELFINDKKEAIEKKELDLIASLCEFYDGINNLPVIGVIEKINHAMVISKDMQLNLGIEITKTFKYIK